MTGYVLNGFLKIIDIWWQIFKVVKNADILTCITSSRYLIQLYLNRILTLKISKEVLAVYTAVNAVGGLQRSPLPAMHWSPGWQQIRYFSRELHSARQNLRRHLPPLTPNQPITNWLKEVQMLGWPDIPF